MQDKFKLDGTKLMYHPERVAKLVDGHDSWDAAKEIYPIYVEVSPVGMCNHRCTFCAVDYVGYKSNTLDAKIMSDRFDEMAELGVKSVMFAGEGEPMIHRDINLLVFNAYWSGLNVSFTTNGSLLNRLDHLEHVTWIKVSLNAGTRETYSKVHGVKPEMFDTVIDNLRDAVKRKGKCVIGAQMVLLPENEHEIGLLQQIGKDIGLDYVVVKPYSQHKMSKTHKYEGFKPSLFSYVGKDVIVRESAMQNESIPYEKCLSTPNIWGYIQANGDVYSCSAYLLDERFNLGNIEQQTFKEIWQGEKRRKNWELMQSLDIKNCRVNCRMNQCNIYLDELVNEKIEHVNFI